MAILVMASWVGFRMAERKLLETIDTKLARVGLQGQASLTVGLHPLVRVEDISSTRPWVAEGMALTVAVDRVAVAVDVLGGITDDAWLHGPIEVHGVQAEVAPGERAEQTWAESRTASERLSSWIPRLCDHTCAVVVTDADVVSEIPGLGWSGVRGLSGLVTVDGQAQATVNLDDGAGRSIRVRAGLGDWRERHEISWRGTERVTVDLNRLGGASRLGLPDGVRDVVGTVDGVDLTHGMLRVTGADLSAAQGDHRRVSVGVDVVDLPSIPRQMKELKDFTLQGLALRYEDAVRGPVQVNASRIEVGGGPGVYPCTGRRLCPSRVSGLRAVLPAYPGAWTALTAEAGDVLSCGPACLSMKDASLDVLRDGGLLDTAWQQVTATWLSGAGVPGKLSVDGGHLDLVVESNGFTQKIAEDLSAPSSDIPPGRDIASVLAALGQKPGRKPKTEKARRLRKHRLR
ncbi:MAG: hypothetical protein QF464_18560, partial [Myxococcota bacterium]|nr:hypothetical protein [Myxococcota bacterium]